MLEIIELLIIGMRKPPFENQLVWKVKYHKTLYLKFKNCAWTLMWNEMKV
jgi:hypothetical protein